MSIKYAKSMHYYYVKVLLNIFFSKILLAHVHYFYKKQENKTKQNKTTRKKTQQLSTAFVYIKSIDNKTMLYRIIHGHS